MTTLRGLAGGRACGWLGLTALSLLAGGCAATQYGGDACNAIVIGSSASALPLRSVGPLPEYAWMLADPFIDGSGEVACCAGNSYFTPATPADCAAVDCAALRARLTRSELGGRYELEPCGTPARLFEPRPGGALCWVYLDEGKVVGVQAFCFD